MPSRLLTLTGVATLTLGGLLATSGPATADPAHCYGWNSHPDLYSSGAVHFGNGTNIRRGPYTDCDSFGLGYSGHGIDVHCWVLNGSYNAWAYVVDTTTGVAGWAKSDALSYDHAVGTPNC